MIKKLAACLRQYKKNTVYTIILVTLEVIMDVMIPMLMAKLIDLGINAKNMDHILKIGMFLTLSVVLSLIFGTLSAKYASVAAAGFARNVRKDMYYEVQDYSFANIDKFSTASLVTRLTTDVSNVQNAFQIIIRVALRSPVMLVFSMFMSFSINRHVSLIFVCIIPFLAVALYIIVSKVHPIFTRVFHAYDKLNSTVQENLRGIRVVKSFVREDYEVKKFRMASNTIYKEFRKAEKILALNGPFMQLSMNASMLLIAWFGAKLIIGSSMTTGELTSILSYAMQILFSLMLLSVVFVTITMSRASAKRIVEVLEEVPDLTNGSSSVNQVEDGSISFCNVSFSYIKDKNKLSLKNINLTIESGETVGIIGGTGAAKTSLVQLIPRLYDVTEGTISVGGVNVRDYNIHTLRDEVAMVLQKNTLFSGTVKENLRWGCENASDEELVRVCKLAQADDFIHTFPDGYDTYIEQDGSNVSGGQKQRLCIARALLKKPKILILDDSTSAVDTKTDAYIRKAFRDEIPHTTKIIISQRISSVEDADKIVIMDSGSIDAIGTHEELLRNNTLYYELYNSQMKGGTSHETK